MLYNGGYHDTGILKSTEVVWCIYIPFIGYSPVLAKITYEFENGYMITEHGFGETSRFIKKSHIVMYGTFEELTDKLAIWTDMQKSINLTITKIENRTKC